MISPSTAAAGRDSRIAGAGAWTSLCHAVGPIWSRGTAPLPDAENIRANPSIPRDGPDGRHATKRGILLRSGAGGAVHTDGILVGGPVMLAMNVLPIS